MQDNIAVMFGRQTSADSINQAEGVRLVVYDEICPYLKNHQAKMFGFLADRMDTAFYRRLMDSGFRRSGNYFYQPQCGDCSKCVPIRIPVDRFVPSKSQRRCRRGNSDLILTVGKPELTQEKFDLYVSYLREQHGDNAEKGMGILKEFLYNQVVDTCEFCYRDRHGKLLAVGICDLFDDAISSVYCFYDVGESGRSLGTYSILCELEYARQTKLAYYYLGFLVSQCDAMAYKERYRPYQLLGPDGLWQ